MCEFLTGKQQKVVEWLEQVRKLDQLITAKIAERDRLIAMATDISARPNDGMPHSDTGTVSRKVENAVVKLVDLADELNKLIDQYIDAKAIAVQTLEKLPEKEYAVMHRYYIRFMTLEQIAEDLNYCTTQIWRIKKNALIILEDVIECNAIPW